MRRRLKIRTGQTMRTATDRNRLLTGIMLNSEHPVHAWLLPEGGVSAGPSNETGRHACGSENAAHERVSFAKI